MTAEDDRTPVRAAQDLVHEGKLQLAVAGAPEVRSQMTGPQPAVLNLALQGRYQPLPDRIVHVVAMGDEVVDRLDLAAHETVDPVELCRKLGARSQSPRSQLTPSKQATGS